MNYQQLSTTVLSLLWASETRPQHREIELVNQLNDFYGFDHNIYLIAAAPDVDRFIDTSNQRDRVPVSITHFNASEMKGIRKIDSKSPLVIVVMEGVCLNCYPGIRQLLVDIHRMQRNTKFGVFISAQFAERDELHKFFVWCWNSGIVHIFVAILDQSVGANGSNFEPTLKSFSFDPFVDFRLVDNTKGESVDRFFPSQNGNYHMHPLRFPGRNSFYNEISSILSRAMNASIKFSYHSTDIDIFPTLRRFPSSDGLSTYPLNTLHQVIIVPKALPYPAMYAYFQSMAVNSVIGLCIGVFVLLIAVVALIRYAKFTKVEIFQSTLDVLNLLINDNSTINYQRLVPAEVALIVPLTFAGFLISNLVLSIVISFFCDPHMQPEIDSMEDLYKSPVKFAVPKSGYIPPVGEKLISALNNQFPQYDWRSKMLYLEESIIDKEFWSRNPTITKLSDDKEAKIIFEAQRRTEVPGYRIPHEVPVLSTRLLTYWVNESFPFIERVNEICHWMHTFGFYQKWDSDEILQAARWVETQQSQYMPATTEEDAIPVIVIHCWILSCLVFLLEILWKRLELWRAERWEKAE